MRMAIRVLGDAIKEVHYALCLAWMDEDTWFIAVILTVLLGPFACLAAILCSIE